MSHKPDQIPDGGCIKCTEGTYFQVFDKDGKLVESSFIAGEAEYEDAAGEALDNNDPRIHFYHPFKTGMRKKEYQVFQKELFNRPALASFATREAAENWVKEQPDILSKTCTVRLVYYTE